MARSEVLEMLEVKEDMWFGRLDMMTPRRSSGCGACFPELATRRHRGRSLAPWTVVMLRQPSQSIHTSREA